MIVNKVKCMLQSSSLEKFNNKIIELDVSIGSKLTSEKE